MTSQSATVNQQGAVRPPAATSDYFLRQGLLKLLAIKDSDVRLLCLEQCRDAVDKSLHAGGAFSATIPLVALYYGGFMNFDVVEPTRRGQDLFVLSKGHAVAALAAIYADLGYFDASLLQQLAVVREHPERPSRADPARRARRDRARWARASVWPRAWQSPGGSSPRFDVYCLTGDGELQEGPIWEAVMYAGQKHLDNLCVMVDRNNGQLDIANRMVFPMPELEAGVRLVRLGRAQRRRHAVRRASTPRSRPSATGRATAGRRRSSATG